MQNLGWLISILRPIQKGNVWLANTIKIVVVTKKQHVNVALSGQAVLNEQNVLQCFIKCLTSFKFYQTRSNKVSKRENVCSIPVWRRLKALDVS